jgi:hypothetical protein
MQNQGSRLFHATCMSALLTSSLAISLNSYFHIQIIDRNSSLPIPLVLLKVGERYYLMLLVLLFSAKVIL